jgi:hypothetical protein
MSSANLFRPPACSMAMEIAFMPGMVKHCFRSGQALPAPLGNPDNPPMPTQAELLAEKIRFLLEHGFLQTQAVIDACRVTKQAINGWKRTGRIAKQHLPVIADLAGVDVQWLLNPEAPRQDAVISMRAGRPRWPFKLVSWERYSALSEADRSDLDARLDRIVAGYEATESRDPRKSLAGRFAG